jgi:hypothetical protein
MNKKLSAWAAIAGIVGLFIAVLALFRDTFDITLRGAQSDPPLSGVTNNNSGTNNNSTIIQGGDIIVQNAPAEKDVPLEEAIRIEVSDRCSSALTYHQFILLYQDDGFKLEGNSLTGTKVCTYQGITVDVIGKTSDEWVKLAPYLVVRITDTKPLESNGKFHAVSETFGGAADSPDRFETMLSPERTDVFAATLVPGYARDPNIDNSAVRQSTIIETQGYFTLQYGERESFLVDTHTYPGYDYKFELGIVYTYNGEATIKWINKTFSATGATEVLDLWVGSYGGEPPKQIGGVYCPLHK